MQRGLEAMRPWVINLGEHLNGHGELCGCARGILRDGRTPAPLVVEQPTPAAPKKLRVPTWDQAELEYAAKHGHRIWISSQGGI